MFENEVVGAYSSPEVKAFSDGAILSLNKIVHTINSKLAGYRDILAKMYVTRHAPESNQLCQMWTLERILSASLLKTSKSSQWLSIFNFPLRIFVHKRVWHNAGKVVHVFLLLQPLYQKIGVSVSHTDDGGYQIEVFQTSVHQFSVSTEIISILLPQMQTYTRWALWSPTSRCLPPHLHFYGKWCICNWSGSSRSQQ